MQFFTEYNYNGIIGITKAMHDVILCCIMKDAKYSMDMAYVEKEKNRVLATDGRRLIIIGIPDIVEIKTGHYLPAKVGKNYFLIPFNIAGDFPSPDKAIPDYKNVPNILIDQRFFNISRSKMYLKSQRTLDNSQFTYRLLSGIGTCINLEYLIALSYLGIFNVKYKEGGVVVFYGNEFQYIVMPMMKP